jgi:NAD(P)H dehydrogenase (quinone)
VTTNEIAAAFTQILGRSVQTQIVPRNSWEGLFKSQGMKNPLPRMQMLDGFNEGWIQFESGEAGSRKGGVCLESVLQGLIQQSSAH